MKPKQYRILFSKGVPVSNCAGRFVWRHGFRTVRAYSLIEAVRKVKGPMIREYGSEVELKLNHAFSREFGVIKWNELDISAFPNPSSLAV